MKNLLSLPITFSTKELSSDEESLYVEGYANTSQKDRSGDVIPKRAWEKPGALDNYRKNPIVLAFHDPQKPIGSCEAISADDMGLKVRAKVEKEANPTVFSLIKKGILKTFSVGFLLKDATYDEKSDTFFLEEIELFEVSVVSIPDNQDAMFSVAKQLGENNDLLTEIKRRDGQPSDKPNETVDMSDKNTPAQNGSVSPADISKAVADALAKQKEVELEAQRAKEAKERELENVRKAAAEAARKTVEESLPTVVSTAGERLAEDITKELLESDTLVGAVSSKFEKEIEELRDELMAIQKTGVFNPTSRDETAVRGISAEQKDCAVLLAKCLTRKGKPVAVTETEYFQEITKAAGFQSNDSTTPIPGVHTVNDLDWETEFSMRMWDDIRRRLVVEPNFQTVAMMTNHMRIPVNPEQGYASYVAIDNFKSSNSTPAADEGNRLTEKTLIAHKLAAKDYIGDEETEDTILPIMGIIRENLIRRMAKSSERSVLLGVGATAADPVKGLYQFAVDDGNDGTTASNTLSIGGGDKLTALALNDARRSLGVFGIDPREVVYIVGDRGYYDLLDDEDFRTRDKVGEANATILQGEIGRINGSPVIVSGEMSFTPTAGTPAALVANMRNFLLGQLRGMRVRTDVDIEEEKTIIVASRRFGTVAMEANGVASVDFAA